MSKPRNPKKLRLWRLALIKATHRRVEAALLSGESVR